MRPDAYAKAMLLIVAAILQTTSLPALSGSKARLPNFLFVIMDDVGIDQMPSFGYGGASPAAMPVIDSIARSGVRFRNNWTTPSCSPSRANFFQGRFPLRSNILNPIGQNDLANSMVSPYDVSLPKLLKKRNYQSALFGKFHLGLQAHNPYGLAMAHSLGFDYFFGWTDETGDPQAIDTTAGGIGGPNGNGANYTCGFVPAYDASKPELGGADTGACYLPKGACEKLVLTDPRNPPGRMCRDRGGIFNPNAECAETIPDNIQAGFNKYNGHFVSPLAIVDSLGKVEEIPATDIRSRTYRGTSPVDAAIDWINKQPSGQPWMATVSFAADHTPLNPPPLSLLKGPSIDVSGMDCSNPATWRTLSDQMIEAMDTEIGRLLVETKLARVSGSHLVYQPEKTNTMVVIVGDNGSFGYTVKLPFDSTRAKGTPYQTGVWTPLIVAGPLTKAPNRDVGAMTNAVDIFQLFGDMAGIDVHKSVPWRIDSTAILPYLKNPGQAAIRKWNYTEIGDNLQANGAVNGPCVTTGTCVSLPPDRSVCEDNGGVWWGKNPSDDPTTEGVPKEGLARCCDVNIWKTDHGQDDLVSIVPQAAIGIRNSRYKLVRNTVTDWDKNNNSCVEREWEEFYRIDENPASPKLDTADSDLLADDKPLGKEQKSNYKALKLKLKSLQNSVLECEGDGNLDGKVNNEDMEGWRQFSQPSGSGGSSWFDFNLDGVTDDIDREIIEDHMGERCRGSRN